MLACCQGCAIEWCQHGCMARATLFIAIASGSSQQYRHVCSSRRPLQLLGRQHTQAAPAARVNTASSLTAVINVHELCPAGGPDSKGEGRLQRSGDLCRVNTCQIHTISCRGGALLCPAAHPLMVRLGLLWPCTSTEAVLPLQYTHIS